jgi:hypothetical protein
LLLGQSESQGGSLAQSQTHDTILGIALDGIHEELAGLFEKSLRKVVDYNFNTETYPNFEFEEFKEKDYLTLLNALEPYGRDALINTDDTWFKQLLSMVVEKMTGVKVDVDEETLPPQPNTVPPIPTNTVQTTLPTDTTLPGSVVDLNSKVKELLPNG